MSTNRQSLSTVLVFLTVVLLGVSLIAAPFPEVQYLQHAPTVVALVALMIAARREWLTLPSLACVVAFWWLHILGARYAYSNVPYDAWSLQVFGASVSGQLGWERNHYDRLVHFLFGLLCVLPAVEIATVRGRMRLGWAIAFALSIVMTIGAVYEIFEWLLTAVASPENAESYNGQQGDMWDPQKDMALAGLGALFALPIVWKYEKPKSEE